MNNVEFQILTKIKCIFPNRLQIYIDAPFKQPVFCAILYIIHLRNKNIEDFNKQYNNLYQLMLCQRNLRDN